MMAEKTLTQARLKERLKYDPETGVFTWAASPHGRHPVGSIAGTIDAQGYQAIKIDRKTYKAHRLAWLFMTGEWPQDEMDHKDTVRLNNAWANLRAATHSQNQANSKRPKNNTSGVKGVWWHKKRQRWRAAIGRNGKTYSLGDFKSISAAKEAYAKAASAAFGEFARA